MRNPRGGSALGVLDADLALEMLVAALSDDDAHNVQLAARYLGARGMRNAASALEAVANGEGRGNRENGPRVEAIEALGRMGAVESLPTLQAIARRRSLIGAARAKELRTAAESAIGLAILVLLFRPQGFFGEKVAEKA